MPIRPEEKRRYPANWDEVSQRIRKGRAGDRCECTGQCGSDHSGYYKPRCNAPNGNTVRRLYADPSVWGNSRNEPGAAGTSKWATPIRIVLTVAHLNHTPEDCRDENLVAMCQRCHLLYDKEHHAETRRRGKPVQQSLG